jgi:hypothetical protein
MTDLEIIIFLRKMAVLGLTSKGVIIFRDNVPGDTIQLNLEEGALVRPDYYLEDLVKLAGYKVVRQTTSNVFKGMMPIQTIVAQPKYGTKVQAFLDSNHLETERYVAEHK